MVEGKLARFGHHPEAVIDYLIEVEEIESITENTRLGLTGFGHEEDRAVLDCRIERALEFRVGGDAQAVDARQSLKSIATERGFDLMTAEAYFGQPIPRVRS